jgi:hypothetical protein
LHIKLIYRFQVVPQSVFEAVFETLGIKINEFINQQQVEFIESFFFHLHNIKPILLLFLSAALFLKKAFVFLKKRECSHQRIPKLVR